MGPQLLSRAMVASVHPKASSAEEEMGPKVFHTPLWVPDIRANTTRMYHRRLYTFMTELV